jgi:ubiquinone/menaquinone biosynthesis C-methylase UbiE
MVDVTDPLGVGATQPRHNEEVANYYRSTWLDYFLLWTNSDNLALHFGYRENGASSHSRSLFNANEVLADTISIRPGEHILDAGCGLGGSSFWLATHRRAAVTGIALGPDQILFSSQEAEHRRLTRLTSFVVADFEQLPFSKETFDAVWAQESLCHAADKASFFNEAFRVLRSGGRIVISDFFLRSQSVNFSDETILREWLEAWRIPFLWTAAEHSNAAKSAGFSKLLIRDVSRCTSPSHRRLYNLATLLQPAAAVLERLGVGNSFQHGNVLAGLRQYQALRNDCWFYGILSGRKLG